MSFDARRSVPADLPAGHAEPPAHIALAKVAPELLGRIGEAFATSLWALRERLSALPPPGEPHRPDFDAVVAAVMRMERLAVQLQELARVLAGAGSTAPEPLDLTAAVRESVRDWTAAAQRRGARLAGPGPAAEAIRVRASAGVVGQLLDLVVDHATRIAGRVEAAVELQGQPAHPMLTLRLQRDPAVARAREDVGEVHWQLFTVLARASGLAAQRVVAGEQATLMLGFPVDPAASDEPAGNAARLPRTPIAVGRQVLLIEPRELPRVQAHRLLRDAGMEVDAVASLDQARPALRDRLPDVLVTGLGSDERACGDLIDELRVAQPRLRVIELVDDDNAFALSLPGAGHAGRVGRGDMARTLVPAVSQELDAAWSGVAA
jgi:hypothetical protein